MSTTTENFGIVLPEGSDTFNPLTFNNNAFALVDEVMKTNQDRGTSPATHVYIDGVNTISRNIPTCNMFVFIASADYAANSVTIVDGVTVTVRYADGTAPKDGAFRTNQAVVCYLNGNILNIVSMKTATGNDVTLENGKSVETVINEINSNFASKIDKTFTATGAGDFDITFGFDVFNVVLDGRSYPNTSVPFLRITLNTNGRYWLIGSVITGANLGGSFLVYNSWMDEWKKL